MAQKLAKHGSEAGYKAHLETGDVCLRCANAHRVYARQYRAKGKAAGLHYGVYDVIDHLYSQSRAESGQRQRRAEPRPAPSSATESTAETAGSQGTESRSAETEESPRSQNEPTLADRLGSALKGAFVPPSNDYVENGDGPDYIHPIDPDAEPAGDWSQVDDSDEYIINKAGMVLIEENLATYLSVVGITLEMIDPYCGPILAENFENIIGRWSKVIARYPRAAKIFLSKDGGTIMLWIGALQATWPVLMAIYDHHLAKTIQTDKQGKIFRVQNQNANGGPVVDATTPPMPEYEYSVG